MSHPIGPSIANRMVFQWSPMNENTGRDRVRGRMVAAVRVDHDRARQAAVLTRGAMIAVNQGSGEQAVAFTTLLSELIGPTLVPEAIKSLDNASARRRQTVAEPSDADLVVLVEDMAARGDPNAVAILGQLRTLIGSDDK